MTLVPPLVSVIIVNYNGKGYVGRCVETVLKNKYPNFEAIVVDNGSKDGSVEFLRKTFAKNKKFKVLALEKNFGPAYARNKGVEKARGQYLAFLDNDTIPEKDWLIFLVKAMEKDSTVGACQCKLLLARDRNKLDYVGDYLSQLGFLVQKCQTGEQDQGQYDQRFAILSAKSAGMGMRREVFDKIGGFDPDYFIYMEETDLGWRSWLAGYRTIFVPESIVYHEFGSSTLVDPDRQNYRVKFHGTKNYIMTLIKNLGLINLIKILPCHCLLWWGIAFWLLAKRQFKNGFLVIKGISWNLIYLPQNLAKRRKIQKARVVKDAQIFPLIFRKTSFAYFYNKFTRPQRVGHAQSWAKEKQR